MRAWLITIGEPLPVDGPFERLLRTGLLASVLAERGHNVTWWTSGFDHIRKRHRVQEDTRIELSPCLELQVLRSPGYLRNVSLARLRDHRFLASSFARLAPTLPPPDIILCSMPTIELSREAVAFGVGRDIPVALDIRDLWPDIFVDLAPSWFRPMASWLLGDMIRDLRTASAGATAILGITDPIVDWGVAYAGRGRHRGDRAFPLGYAEEKPAGPALEQAAAFWDRQLPPGAFVAAFVGTIGRQFDLDTVIEAARYLRNRHQPIHFVLGGRGDGLDGYRKRAQGLDNVLFPGWLDRAQIWELIHRASVGLAPYRNSRDFQASLPNKTFEYLSAGLPIITCLRGELERLVTGNACGSLYREADPLDLAQTLIRLQEAPGLRKDLGAHGHALFLQKFRADTVYSEFAEHMETLAEHRSGKQQVPV